MAKNVEKKQLVAIRELILEAPPPRVALLGGSFDPPHLGHTCLALSIMSSGKTDEVWVLPCADHPQAKNLTPFHHRMEMCHLAFRYLRTSVRVLKVEKYLPAPNYTAQTLQALQKLFPKTQFDWVIGSDLLDDLPSWKDAPWLAKHIRFLVVGRKGFSMNNPPEGFNIKPFFGVSLPDLASRELRMGEGLDKPMDGLDKAVRAYIEEKGLYDDGL